MRGKEDACTQIVIQDHKNIVVDKKNCIQSKQNEDQTI